MRQTTKYTLTAALALTGLLLLGCTIYTISSGVYSYNISGPIPLSREDAVRRGWDVVLRYFAKHGVTDREARLEGNRMILIERQLLRTYPHGITTELVYACQALIFEAVGTSRWESEISIKVVTYSEPCGVPVNSVLIHIAEDGLILPPPKPDEVFNDLYREILHSLTRRE